jgi:hypothetical protein
MAHSGEIVIKGHAPVHSTRVAAIRVDDSVHNFTFDIDTHNFRDLLIENIGNNPVYIKFSPCAIDDIEIPTLSRKDTIFSGENVGWKLNPNGSMIIEYMDFSHIAMKCSNGKSTNIQIMGTLYPLNCVNGSL